MGPRLTAAFVAQLCAVGTDGPLCVAHELARSARVQHLLGMLECTRERAQLTWHAAERAWHATVVRPAASAQRSNVGMVLFYGLVATPRTG
jgi:hypothetical protein